MLSHLLLIILYSSFQLAYSSTEPAMVRGAHTSVDTGITRSSVISDTIREESEPEASIISEESHVDGEWKPDRGSLEVICMG